MLCATKEGIALPAIETPNGTFEPDPRLPVFRPPEWVTYPEVLSASLEARAKQEQSKFPYEVLEVLHYSNSGGVYLCRDKSTSEGEVIIKEARQHSGLDAAGEDAVSRLTNEIRVLKRLSHLAEMGQVPRVIEEFSLGFSNFYAMTRLAGKTLYQIAAESNPWLSADPKRDALERYRREMEETIAAIRNLLDQVHRSGVVYGDFHPKNILITEDGAVSFIDFETASLCEDSHTQRLAAPGFGSPKNKTGIDSDEYAFERIKLWIFNPLVYCLDLAPSRYRLLSQDIKKSYGINLSLPHHEEADYDASQDVSLDAKTPSSLAERLCESILSACDVSRKDRLFPANYRIFDSHPSSFFYGSSGLIWSFASASQAIPDDIIRWHRRAYREHQMISCGLESGIAGAIIAEAALGSETWTLKLAEHAVTLADKTPLISVRSGLSGLLAALTYATERGVINKSWVDKNYGSLASEVFHAAQQNVLCRDGYCASYPLPTRRTPKAYGLIDGWAGVATTLYRWGIQFEQEDYVRLAHEIIQRDIDSCRFAEAFDTVGIDKGFKQDPYLESGSAGVFLACGMMGHELSECIKDGLKNACSSLCFSDGGLMAGLAGQMGVLASLDPLSKESCLNRLCQSFQIYGFKTCDNVLSIFGERSSRLSHDFATGTLGYLHTLWYLENKTDAFLPIMSPTSSKGRG